MRQKTTPLHRHPLWNPPLLRAPKLSTRCTSLQSGNRKGWRQTGSLQSTPLSTIPTRYGNSVSTPEATRTCKTQQNFLQKGSRYGISVSTPHRRYGRDCKRRFCGRHFLRGARLQNKFGTKYFFQGTNFLTKNAPKFCLKFLSLCFTGPKNHFDYINFF